MQIEEALIIILPLIIAVVTLIVTLAIKPIPFRFKKLAKTKIFEFRSERPVNKDGELLFGHNEIVNTLQKVVLKVKKTFTIGIYGDWGSGKSSIAESLQTKLIEEDIPLIIFDVWKHEGDALRRTFLVNLIDTLKFSENYGDSFIDSDFQLNEQTLDQQTIVIEDYTVTLKKLCIHLGIGLSFVLMLMIPLLILWLFAKLPFVQWDIIGTIKTVSTITLSTSLATIAYKYINNFIEIRKTTSHKNRFTDPEQFEKEFKRILKYGLKKEKIVIVFDNLDRVSGDKAVEIISTIKTFLEPIDRLIDKRNVVFIIPCDAEAVKRHLQKSLGYETSSPKYHEYAEEYLRKFFNTIIWIPELYETELEDFTAEQLEKTKIKSLNDFELAGLITIVFGDNPRQIVQFINILVANYLLFEERSISGYPANKNVLPLAKYLLLVQKFPDLIMEYRANKSHDLETGMELLKKTEKYNDDKNNSYRIRVKQLEDFIQLTEQWEIKSLDVFFKFKLSKFEKVFENSSQLISLLQSNRMNTILKNDKTNEDEKLNLETDYMISLNIDERGPEFSKLVREKVKLSQYPNILAQFLNGVCELTKHYKKSLLSDEVYKEIYKKLSKPSFASKIEVLDVNNVVTDCIEKIQSDELRNDFRKTFTDQWIKDFENKHKKSKDDGTE